MSSSTDSSKTINDVYKDLIDESEHIITELEHENSLLNNKLDNVYEQLLTVIKQLENLEDNLYISYEMFEESIKQSNKYDINTDWLDIELKIRCHDAIYKPMTAIVNTLKTIIDNQ